MPVEPKPAFFLLDFGSKSTADCTISNSTSKRSKKNNLCNALLFFYIKNSI